MLHAKHPHAYYEEVEYKTGDLIFFKSLSVKHMLFTNSEFSHLGIVIKINGILYCLELERPNVKLTPLYKRFDLFMDGLIYIKQIDKDIQIDNKKLLEILEWSCIIDFPKSSYKFNKAILKTHFNGIWSLKDSDDLHCTAYIVMIMLKLGLLNKDVDINGNIIDWLAKVKEVPGGTYNSMQRLIFFGETGNKYRKVNWSVRDFMNNNKALLIV